MKVRTACLILALLHLGPTPASAAQKPKPKNKGGVHLRLAVIADGSRVNELLALTEAVIQKRCRLLGLPCKFQRQKGEKANQLELDVSTRMNPDRIKRTLLAEGLELRAVISPRYPEPLLDYPIRSHAMAAGGANKEVFSSPGEERYIVVELVPFFTGDDLKSCVVLRSEENFREYEVDCRLKPAGADRLEAWTRSHVNHYVVMIFNRGVLTVGSIKAPISDNVVVSGGFNMRQARDAAVILQSGNLPKFVEVLEEGERTVRDGP